jgi:hypothetical protein
MGNTRGHFFRGNFGIGVAIALAISLIAAGILGFAGQAKAAPVTLSFDNGRLSFGALLRDQHVLPAADKFPSDSLPLPQRTDIVLNGTESDGQLDFPAAANPGSNFPYMGMDHPAEPGLKIPVTFRLNEPGLTGTFDAATGAATLEGTIDIYVITGQGASFPLPDSLDDLAAPPLGLLARCKIPDVPVSFSTAGEFPYAGSPFTAGLTGNGSMSTFWRTVPASISENGGECDFVTIATQAYGGIWLSHGVVETEFRPSPGQPPTCEEDPLACPEPEPAADITLVRLSPRLHRARPGHTTTLNLRIRNSGDAPATAFRATLRSSSRRFLVPRQVRVTVPAGSSVVRRVRVRVLKNARGRARIVASGAGHRSRAVIAARAPGR